MLDFGAWLPPLELRALPSWIILKVCVACTYYFITTLITQWYWVYTDDLYAEWAQKDSLCQSLNSRSTFVECIAIHQNVSLPGFFHAFSDASKDTWAWSTHKLETFVGLVFSSFWVFGLTLVFVFVLALRFSSFLFDKGGAVMRKLRKDKHGVYCLPAAPPETTIYFPQDTSYLYNRRTPYVVKN